MPGGMRAVSLMTVQPSDGPPALGGGTRLIAKRPHRGVQSNLAFWPLPACTEIGPVHGLSGTESPSPHDNGNKTVATKTPNWRRRLDGPSATIRGNILIAAA